MMVASEKTRVAVMNTSKEITDILQELLTREGFETCAVFTYQMRQDESFFDRYIKRNKPQAIVYDIALPYEANYHLFQRLCSRESAKGIPFVLTTTNKDALEKLVGETPTHEIIGKPYDLKQVVLAVNKALTIPSP